ncbi:MAG: signal peptidase I [Chlamydiota bacterium]
MFFTLRKAKKKYMELFSYYQGRKKRLSEKKQARFIELFSSLRSAIAKKDKKEAKKWLKALKTLQGQDLPKPFFLSCCEHAWHFLGALVLAIVVRQMWFELYMIPTGSMRPTFKEGDYVLVNKTAFSLNVPLSMQHFYFNEPNLQHGNIVVFSAENMDIAHADMRYFYLIPGKKQLVKRLVGKPEDTLYFYGGKIYGIDAKGEPITSLLQEPCFDTIEYIPFLQMGGKAKTSQKSTGTFPGQLIYQMNQPIVKLTTPLFSPVKGTILSDNSLPLGSDYYDFWGFSHYASARIVDGALFAKFEQTNQPPDCDYYLELTHHPSMNPGKISQRGSRSRLGFRYQKSYLPLDSPALQRIFSHMNTVRFLVRNERAYPYGRLGPLPSSPLLEGVPDGTYEFDRGVLYQIGWGRRAFELQDNHPLAQFSPERTILLYNLGVEFDTRFFPQKKEQICMPSRYAYFRDGGLYLLAEPIFSKEDSALQAFIEKEKQHESPFIDQGPPLLEDGSFDVEKIRTYGLRIPKKHYLVLGDNHPISGDSREFGFVPEENFKGSVSSIFFPFGSRFGSLVQPSSSWYAPQKLFVWIVCGASILIVYCQFERKWKKF